MVEAGGGVLLGLHVFLGWKNMKCCRVNIEVSIFYVVVLSVRHFVFGIKRALRRFNTV
jgi:hypothetical protein